MDFSLMYDYFALTKPGVMSVILMTTFFGFFLALSGEAVPWPVLLHTLFGTALVAAGAGTLNMLLEVEPDGLMNRTKSRPLPSGRIPLPQALFFGSLCAAFGIVHLSVSVRPLTGFLAFLSLALYLVFYTPLKMKSPVCTVVGAVAGALPPLIGWSAVHGALSFQAWSLFLILFLWQFPHLLALAWMFREDYALAGFKIVPEDADGKRTAKIALAGSLLLFAASFLPAITKLSGGLYLAAALVVGRELLWASFQFLRNSKTSSARRLFLSTIFYAPALLAFMVVSQWRMPPLFP